MNYVFWYHIIKRTWCENAMCSCALCCWWQHPHNSHDLIPLFMKYTLQSWNFFTFISEKNIYLFNISIIYDFILFHEYKLHSLLFITIFYNTLITVQVSIYTLEFILHNCNISINNLRKNFKIKYNLMTAVVNPIK